MLAEAGKWPAKLLSAKDLKAKASEKPKADTGAKATKKKPGKASAGRSLARRLMQRRILPRTIVTSTLKTLVYRMAGPSGRDSVSERELSQILDCPDCHKSIRLSIGRFNGSSKVCG